MIKALKTCVLICSMLGVITIAVVSITILAQLAVDHTTSYIEVSRNVLKVEQLQKTEEFSLKLIRITEEAIRVKNEKEKELEALKRVTDDLYARLNNKEGIIADYCQSTQDLSVTNMRLVSKVNNLSALVRELIKRLPEEDRKSALKMFLEISSVGGKTE